MSTIGPIPPASSGGSASSSAGDRVILRIGRKNPDGTSRPGSGTGLGSIHPHQPSGPPASGYSRPVTSSGGQQVYHIQPHSNSYANPTAQSSNSNNFNYPSQPSYPNYQPYGHGPARSDSTVSLPAANEIYTITRGGVQPSLAHSSSAAVTGYPGSASNAQQQQQGRPLSGVSHTMSRAGSTASLPLAVALGNDIHLPSSSLSPVGSLKALTPVNASASSSSSNPRIDTSSSSSDLITIPSLLSPSHRIDVPLIKWSELSLAEPGQAQEKTKTIKNEFHANLRNFLKTAKRNIEEMTMELFYSSEEDSDEEENSEATGDASTSTPPKKKPSPQLSLVTKDLLTQANSKQLGSPRKTALLQELVKLSSQMDHGLESIQAMKESDLKKQKQGHTASSASAPRFNKNDIAQLASLVREEAKEPAVSASPSKSLTTSTSYPSTVSSSSTAALKAFVRRSQLGERHKAYETWIAAKEEAQEKSLRQKEKEEKMRRLKELEDQRKRAERERQTQLEYERARAEEESLRTELEAQRAQEEAEAQQREEYERRERERLEQERQQREEQRKAQRESELARQKLEEEIRRREEEDRAWEREKRQREEAENEAKRLTEELKAQVVKDLAMVTASSTGVSDQQERRDEEELDALFAAAASGADSASNPQPSASDPDTDEEFAEFGSPRAAAEVRASKQSAGGGAGTARGPAPIPPPASTGALAGRKGRTVARTAAASAGFQVPPNFPQAPSLPFNVQGSPRTAVKPMSFGNNTGTATSSTNFRFERAKRMHGR